ncbi:MAG: isocitrate lyase/PEP mutase family protein [Hydrogenophaga sp.]|jgi:2-methylisocitrate lyase-like PEP mutase family enzyme|uniref:isocitrate lyase/PEP mutase family protein n=1 Tax=Hydrogenophaga sp. TaxID=1904254 RepID=UPI001DEC038C|nr:isocitrate lyase/PEP mutase family protein [Hydrogenophaga sp.]MBW0170469.1 isocitrate lyase/PEP mutase family protein [Hydrogenophaga sp.]MBW0182778.1 isocitrate lyase/PEP mutase family protein [Hydrogenophaga sp.]
MNPASQLRGLLQAGEIVMAPGAPDSITARLVQKAGFPAVYMTGFGATASRLGTPDIGLLSQTEMTGHARDMVRAVDIPVIADADTGYGGPSNIHRTVREYLQAGVAAIHLEDQVAPKRCGQMAGIRLMDADENVRRLRCAVESRGDGDLLIIGRTDALPAAGIDEAVRRAKLYQQAGVDLVFVDGIKTVAEVEAVARAVSGPKVVSLVDGTPAAALTAAQLQSMGFSVVFYAVTALFTAVRAVSGALAELRRAGTPVGAVGGMVSYAEFTELVDLDFHKSLDDRFGS